LFDGIEDARFTMGIGHGRLRLAALGLRRGCRGLLGRGWRTGRRRGKRRPCRHDGLARLRCRTDHLLADGRFAAQSRRQGIARVGQFEADPEGVARRVDDAVDQGDPRAAFAGVGQFGLAPWRSCLA
jgi:hypothetical protein